MLNTIKSAWNWIGLEPAEIVEQNAFGNLVVCATDGHFWRICPEELSCRVIATDSTGYELLRASEEFGNDWEMNELIALAARKFGPMPPDRCYCLKMPGVFGGKYAEDNLGTITRAELVAFAGDMARQIKDFPDGSRGKLKVVWSEPN